MKTQTNKTRFFVCETRAKVLVKKKGKSGFTLLYQGFYCSSLKQQWTLLRCPHLRCQQDSTPFPRKGNASLPISIISGPEDTRKSQPPMEPTNKYDLLVKFGPKSISLSMTCKTFTPVEPVPPPSTGGGAAYF